MLYSLLLFPVLPSLRFSFSLTPLLSVAYTTALSLSLCPPAWNLLFVVQPAAVPWRKPPASTLLMLLLKLQWLPPEITAAEASRRPLGKTSYSSLLLLLFRSLSSCCCCCPLTRAPGRASVVAAVVSHSPGLLLWMLYSCRPPLLPVLLPLLFSGLASRDFYCTHCVTVL